MKRINRAQLRGKPLDEDCKKAYTLTHEYGEHDNRVFCMGLIDLMDDEPVTECEKCAAWYRNATPLQEAGE